VAWYAGCMNILQKVTQVIQQLSIGVVAAGGIIESAADVPTQVHVIAGIAVLIATAVAEGVRAAASVPKK